MRVRLALAGIGVAIIAALLIFSGSGSDGNGLNRLGPAGAQTATDPKTGLPIVDGGDPAKPTPGTVTNQDPRTPPVSKGDIVDGWTGLDQLLGNDVSYISCVNNTAPMFSWGRDVPKFKEVEARNIDTRFILAVNTTASDSDVKRIAAQDIGENVDHLSILRVSSIINTRGFKDGGGCESFLDKRSMVRVSLGRVVFNTDGSVKGVANDGGVLVDCHNPWRLPPPETTTQTTQPGASTTVPPNVTTTVPPGVTTTRPPVTTTVPPGVTTTRPPVTTTVPPGVTTTAPPGSTVPPNPTTTVTVPPETEKCKLENGSLVPGFDPDGDGFCGSAGTDPTHPQFPVVQSEPISDPTLNDPTTGYNPGPITGPGDAETNSQGQAQAATQPVHTPDPYAQPSPSPAGNPGNTVTPSGTPVTGGTSGVTQPDSSPGHQTQPVNTTPVAPVGGPTPPGGLTPP